MRNTAFGRNPSEKPKVVVIVGGVLSDAALSPCVGIPRGSRRRIGLSAYPPHPHVVVMERRAAERGALIRAR
jgi:hypothetical protein